MENAEKQKLLEEIERDKIELKPYREFVKTLTLDQRLRLKKWLGAKQPLANELRDYFQIVRSCGHK
jgi:hypothetical protein